MKQISVAICAVILAATSVFCQQTAAASKTEKGDVNQKGNVQELINRYFESLNETNEKRRRELTKQVWAEKGKFGTPYGEVAGQEAIEALIAGVKRDLPTQSSAELRSLTGLAIIYDGVSHFPQRTEHQFLAASISP